MQSQAEILTLMQESRNGGKIEPRWLSAALTYFHDLSVKGGEKVRNEDVMADENRMTMRVGGSSNSGSLKPQTRIP